MKDIALLTTSTIKLTPVAESWSSLFSKEGSLQTFISVVGLGGANAFSFIHLQMSLPPS